MAYDQPELFPLDPVFEAASKRDLKPFERLTRELDPVNNAEGISNEILELDTNLQDQIFSWVEVVEQPFDLVQRTEGRETPAQVYFGAQNKATKNMDGPSVTRAVTRASAGRAALHRERDTTLLHSVTAVDRFKTMARVLRNARMGRGNTPDDLKHAVDSFQELANGLAANLDNLYPGGDVYAHQVGATIDAFAHQLYEDETLLGTSKLVLISASANYVLKQKALWDKKLAAIDAFASEHQITLGMRS